MKLFGTFTGMQLSCTYASMVSNLGPTMKKLDVASRNVNAICREEIQRFFQSKSKALGFLYNVYFCGPKM